MTSGRLIIRSLRYHARSHLGPALGAAIGTAVLVGALVIGDSVRGSLRETALARLGHTGFAIESGDRFFRADLAGAVSRSRQIITAPALQLPGTAVTSDGAHRANRVRIIGIDDSFWQLAREKPAFPDDAGDGLLLNEPLARQLQAKPGDTLLLRIHKPSLLSREAPISPQEDFSLAWRLPVSGIVSDVELGRFSLRANQLPPNNAFVPLRLLQEQLDLPGRANVLLIGSAQEHDATTLQAAIQQEWKLPDAELELRELPQAGVLELRTRRVFLDPPVAAAVQTRFPHARGVLTYFVNEFRAGDRTTPYSMVAAMGAPVVPADMRDDEILINEWLAEDLQVQSGDDLQVTYFVPASGRQLEERAERFRVARVVPLSGATGDRELMPDFPGLAEAESTGDWDAGFPIEMNRIRPKDEQYWKDHRGAPKAFITLAAGQRLWSNRFGNLTAIRFHEEPEETDGKTASSPRLSPPPGEEREQRSAFAPEPGSPNLAVQEIEPALLNALNPAAAGLLVQPVREQALAASAQAQDFGQLFLGLSFFLIVAALLLMALLFQFGLEQRAAETGTLLALGFTSRQVRRMTLVEGALVAALGGIAGALGGLLYARAMLHGLQTVWRDAVAGSALQFHFTPATLAIGAAASLVVCILTIWIVLRGQTRRPARELLIEGAEEQRTRLDDANRTKAWPARLAAMTGAIGAGLIGWALLRQEMNAAGVFFGGGALLLVSGLACTRAVLRRMALREETRSFSISGLGLRNCTRRSKRSVATIALLAGGTFLIVAVGAHRLDPDPDSDRRASGTGGFAFIGESALPVVHRLDTAAGREFFGLDERKLAGVAVAPLRVRDGDDASCLNLNRAQRPRVLGVDPELLRERGAFQFKKVAKGFSLETGWDLLAQPMDGIPAIGDDASVTWALGRKVGDVLIYEGEDGEQFKVRIVATVANSILQGNLLISEANFIKVFPGESGYRMFFVDAPSKEREAVAATLVRGLQDVGLELVPAAQRLAEFNAVQNTYLSTFQVLGGLGLLLGSAGLGVVVLRNVLERRGELALLLALGFRQRTLRRLVLSEHAALLVIGLAIGVVAALAAVLPVMVAPGAALPHRSVALMLAAVLVSGLAWTWLATRIALRGDLLDALRRE